MLLGNGDGTFQSAANFDSGQFPAAAAVGDFNGDGKPDLAVANQTSGDVGVLLNTTGPGASPPTFSGPTSLPVGVNHDSDEGLKGRGRPPAQKALSL